MKSDAWWSFASAAPNELYPGEPDDSPPRETYRLRGGPNDGGLIAIRPDLGPPEALVTRRIGTGPDALLQEGYYRPKGSALEVVDGYPALDFTGWVDLD